MKYSVFTVGLPEMKPEEELKNIKECEYDGVEWRVTNLPTDPEILKEEPSYWRNNFCTINSKKVEDTRDGAFVLLGFK